MDKKKIVCVIGTRPEAIKMAPVVIALVKQDYFDVRILATGQHAAMLDQVLDFFSLTADRNLHIMKERQTLDYITSSVLTGAGEYFDEVKPAAVLVHGDTTTTFAAGLAAFYRNIPIGHVEAGLRSWNMRLPFPEEMNRKLVTAIADLYFCPTKNNRENLLKEGVTEGLFITGNTVIDALKTTVRKDYRFTTELLNELDYSRKVVLVTCHRRENYGQPMENIMTALRDIALQNEDCELVYPVHLSPVVRENAQKFLAGTPRVHLIDPLSADEMHNLMARCYMVMTDSGGLQEEAPALGKPVLVMRRETERPEAVAAGTVKLCGVEYDDVLRMGNELLRSREAYDAMAHAVNPYGDGHACARIADAILWHFGRRSERPADFNA